MATLSRGQTFGASETVTNTKLHNLVDLGSVTSIVDADCDANMGLQDTKIADITTGNKVRGTALGNLASIPSSAGVIPPANMAFSSWASFASISNYALQPLTLASWVDGAAMRNIQSMPSLAGQLSYYSIVTSLASGGIPQFDGVNNFTGGLPVGVREVSKTSISSSNNSGDISILNNQFYEIKGVLRNFSGDDIIAIRLNNNTGANYNSITRGFLFDGTPTTSNSVNASATSITLGPCDSSAASEQVAFTIRIYPQRNDNQAVWLKGEILGQDNTSAHYFKDIAGQWASGGSALVSFRIFSQSAATFSGEIYLYQHVI